VSALLRDPDCASVSVISRNPTKNLHQGAGYYPGDITNESRLRALLFKIQPRVVFVCCSPQSTASASELRNTIVKGTEVLLKCAAKSPWVQALVFTSSEDAVMLSPTNSMITEETAQLYSNSSRGTPLQTAKGIADDMVLKANGVNLRTTCLRLPLIYGEGDPCHIPNILHLMRRGQQTLQIGPNEKVFEHINVANAVHAHILASKALLLGPEPRVDGEAFFITDGQPMKFYDFARKVWVMAGDRSEKKDIRVVSRSLVLSTVGITEWLYFIFTLGTKRPDVLRKDVLYLDKGTWFSIEKARQRLGYSPQVSVDDGIRSAVEVALYQEEMKKLVMGVPERGAT
jgi:sterol-4alpha-carboxylate 3-dehydrogenase (decarboxylating)